MYIFNTRDKKTIIPKRRDVIAKWGSCEDGLYPVGLYCNYFQQLCNPLSGDIF